MNKMIKHGLFALILSILSLGSTVQAVHQVIFTTGNHHVVLTARHTKSGHIVYGAENCRGSSGGTFEAVKYNRHQDSKPGSRATVNGAQLENIAYGCHGHYKNRIMTTITGQLITIDAKLLKEMSHMWSMFS